MANPADKHINYLELKAAKIALVTLASQFRDTHVRIYLDNVCAVAYIYTNTGGGGGVTLLRLQLPGYRYLALGH